MSLNACFHLVFFVQTDWHGRMGHKGFARMEPLRSLAEGSQDGIMYLLLTRLQHPHLRQGFLRKLIDSQNGDPERSDGEGSQIG